MKKNIWRAGALMMALTLATACSDDEPKISDVSITCNAPQNVTVKSITNVKVTLNDISSGEAKEFSFATVAGPLTLQVNEGLYNVELEGDITYTVNGVDVTSKIRGSKENVQIVGEFSLALDTYFHAVKDGFVLAELCFSGTLTPEGKDYTGDSYFRIVNNSDETLYADGLCIFESAFQNDMKEDYKPNVMAEAMSVDTGFRIPGSGKDHPVKPGESLLICDNAINHKEINPNSYDLSKADFEWTAESSNPDFVDPDNPAVPNLEPIMKSSMTLWQPHVRGVKSYALAYMSDTDGQMSPETYLSKYFDEYTYLFVFGEFQTEMSGEAYMLPNMWINDAVNVSPVEGKEWLVTAPSLDKGFTYVSEVAFDNSRYGKAMRRKVDASTGKLVDTNNSSEDFEHRVEGDPYHVFK